MAVLRCLCFCAFLVFHAGWAAVCTYSSKRYNEGETWASKGFLWKCGFDGQPGVIGCVSGDNEILLNEYRIVNGYNRTCYEEDGKYFLSEIYCGTKCTGGSGGVLQNAPYVTPFRPTRPRPTFATTKTTKTSPATTTTAKKHAYKCPHGSPVINYNEGDEWQDSKYLYACEQHGRVKATGCISSDGIVVKAGSRDERGQMIRVCELKYNGLSYTERQKTEPEIAASLDAKSAVQEQKCEKDGGSYSVGEIWVGKGFKFLCKPKGAYEIIACVSPNAGIEVPINRIIERQGWKLNCTRSGHNVFLKEEYMGRRRLPTPTEKELEAMRCKYENQEYRPGQTWRSRDFRYMCTKKGESEIIGCVAKDGYELAVGREITTGPIKRRCEQEGHSVFYSEETREPAITTTIATSTTTTETTTTTTAPATTRPPETASTKAGSKAKKGAESLQGRGCSYNAKSYKAGQTWKSDNFKFKCGELGFGRVVACVTDGGMEIDMNMELMHNGTKHRCYFQNGAAQYEAVPMKKARRGCVKNGKQYAGGQTWTANGFRYKCLESGRLTIIACLTDDRQEVAVGQKLLHGGLVHECVKEGNRYMYRADYA